MTTGIEWTDETWNPMTGCTKLSPDAITAMHIRSPRFWEDRLLKPLSWKEPRRVFVNSMSDVFHA